MNFPLVLIDLNIRVEGNRTMIGYSEHADMNLTLGQWVLVRGEETNIFGFGRVARIDRDRDLLYLEVDWSDLRELDL